MSQISENLKAVRTKIEKAAQQWKRDPQDINLVAVSKKQPDERIDVMLEAGQRVYGENRVQEAYTRWEGRRDQYPDLVLHLIGPLQTNKVKEAVSLFDVIEIVDRPKLVKALGKECKKQNKFPQFFIQVNVGDEDQKAGVAIDELPDLLQLCHDESLTISGLMCIPPFDDPPAPYFALLNKLAAQHDLKELSMGMSGDFEKAIPLGATYVRVGTALFGLRPSPSGA
ncbi:MAG: YggS family pyridoxal phosphate-dependent enzyme [Pseudomonadota bacterium]